MTPRLPMDWTPHPHPPTQPTTPTVDQVWKADQYRGDLNEQLCAELCAIADEIEDAPRQYRQVLLLGELAAYLSQSHAPARNLCRRFAHMAQAWGDALDSQIKASVPEHQDDLAAKQRLFYLLALTCYRTLILDTPTVEAMVRLLV